METFGEKLRFERESRGLSIPAVAKTLGVEQGRLLALERNDLKALPDESVMMDCLRAYAACLDVDADLMIEDYVRERDRCLRQLAGAVTHRARRPRLPLLLVALAILAAAAVVAGAWWMLSGDRGVPVPEEAIAPVVAAPAAVEPAPLESRVEATQRPAPAPSQVSRLSVSDHGVGTAVRDRELVGRGDRFAEGTEVWFWTRVEAGSPGDRIDHLWLREGVEAERMSLRVNGSRWRTYSAKMLRAGSAGQWAVEARDATGRVLARREFACVP